jgi:RimJ/RimL family protein N-acetyltransferase
MDWLRAFHEVCASTADPLPPWEHWEPVVRAAMAERKAELWPIRVGEVFAGGVFFAGDTIHIAIKPEFHCRWATRRLRRAYDTWTHAVPIRALIKPDNKQSIRLATGLGFKFVADQGLYHLYVKEANHA